MCGMYDSIIADCPKCGEKMELQSKSGACLLDRYDINLCPVEVSIGLNGDMWKCQFCNTIFVVKLPLPDKVKLILEEVSMKERILWSLEDGRGPLILQGNYNSQLPENIKRIQELSSRVEEIKKRN